MNIYLFQMSFPSFTIWFLFLIFSGKVFWSWKFKIFSGQTKKLGDKYNLKLNPHWHKIIYYFNKNYLFGLKTFLPFFLWDIISTPKIRKKLYTYKSVQSVLCTNLVQTTATQVVGDDHVCDGVEDKLHILCVGGARHVTVDFLCGGLVLCLELGLDVGSGLSILLCTWNNMKSGTFLNYPV